jgi:tRNA-dihydrouridine synthase B
MNSFNFVKPLHIANKIFPINIIQGPLAGVSCAPFRLLTWQYGKPAFSCTEMISCKTLIHQPRLSHQRFVKKDPDEGPVCFQLSANDPGELSEAVKIVTDYGADLIDLNCGCPVKKIRKKGAGSALLTDFQRLYTLIDAMRKNTAVPISIKIRVEGNGEEKFNHEIVKIVNESGLDFLVVHGRHWTEHYETPCNYDEIQFFVENVKIPVIGNGDISCANTLTKMYRTGCAGAMIGRAGVGQPWLIQKLIAELNQTSDESNHDKNFIAPSNNEIGFIFLEHVQRLIELLNSEKFAIIQSRKFAKYYARNLENKIEFCVAMNACKDLQDLKKICNEFFIIK